MLDIKDISKADRLFNFLSGLQPWAQLELQRQDIKDLSVALVAARLMDLRILKLKMVLLLARIDSWRRAKRRRANIRRLGKKGQGC